MSYSIQSRFLDLANKFRKLHYSTRMQDLSHGEFMMLGTIYFGSLELEQVEIKGKFHNCGVRISELNQFLKGSKSATSKMLRNLEEKGYIKREIDSKDKRNVIIKLSPKGEQILLESKKLMEEHSSRIIERMGVADSEHLLHLLRKLYEIMEEEMRKYVE